MRKFSIKDIFRDESYFTGDQAEIISLTEAKTHLLVEESFQDDDKFISDLIKRSRSALENFCNISLTAKVITLTAAFVSNQGPYKKDWDRGFWNPDSSDRNPWFELPYGPVTSIGSVTGVSLSTITNLVLNTDYYIQGVQFKSIQFISWFDSVVIVYSVSPASATNTLSGFGDALKEALLNEVAFRYENRGDNTNRYAAQNVGICEAAEYLALPYRRLWL